jgi:hypothetical protein
VKKHGRVLNVEGLLKPDLMGVKIAEKWMSWNMARQTKVRDWDEVRRYVYATDTRTTTNSSLPWKNTTTVPKLCQIRDNLHANYMAALFPKRKWLFWHADNPDDNALEKKKAIEEYMSYVIDRPEFKQEVSKMIYDYLDYGNIFATVSWQDDRVEQEKGSTQTGYVGPVPMRISPLDILFNPTAESVWKSPKIVKTIMTIGDLKHYMESLSSEENKEVLNDLFNYLKNSRQNSHQYGGDLHEKDGYLRVDGFDSYRHYLESDYVELLSFYGDMYDVENDKLYSNHIITIADRHKVISIQPNPSYFGNAPIFHAGWRVRQDNLWAMGPLDNLVGMQYRIDHIENLKADIFDLTAFPPIKIKGLVEDFTWGPFEKIYVGDDGDVELMGPDVSILQANMEIDRIELKMEEMAGAPREAMGFRTPGEKTAYEVQRTENAYSRIFQSKIQQFEEQILEPMLNAMLELLECYRRRSDWLWSYSSVGCSPLCREG